MFPVSHLGFFVFFLQLCTSIRALDFARVCQTTGPYAPFLQDCQGYKDSVQQAFPNGTIIQSDPYASCQVVYKHGSCALDVCSFPNQGLNTTAFFTTVDDILNNCQSKQAGNTAMSTGGYNIVLNTNFTVGVLGTATPITVKATTTNFTSPLQSDCANAYYAIEPGQNYTQSSTSNCTILLTSGTCQVGFCDVPGAVISGIELQNYVAVLLLSSVGNDAHYTPARSSGYAQISPDRRVSIFSNQAPTAVTSNDVHCRTYDNNQPSQSECARAWDALYNKNPWGYQLTQANSECTTIQIYGNCQIDICGTGRKSVGTSELQKAYSAVNNTCRTSSDSVGGYARVAGSDVVLSLSSNAIPRNIFCNTAPNNSPKYAECGPALDSIQDGAVYSQSSSTGCSLVASNGACKMNYCAPVGSAISGKDLRTSVGSIITTCVSGDYSSGIYQLNPTTSIGLYDPTNLLSQGIPYCVTSSNSPVYADCIKAVNQLIFTNPNNVCRNNAPVGPSNCTSVAAVGTCQIQLCGKKNEPFDCFSIGIKFDVMMQTCVSGGRIGSFMGLRNAAYGDTVMQIINTGKGSKREAPGLVERAIFDLPEHEADSSPSNITAHNSALEKRILPPNAVAIGTTGLFFVYSAPIIAAGVINRIDRGTRQSIRVRAVNALRAGYGFMAAATPIPLMSETWEFILTTYGDTSNPDPQGPPDLSDKLVSAASNGMTAQALVGQISSFLHIQMDSVTSQTTSLDSFDGRTIDNQGLDVCAAHLGTSFAGTLP